jgi:hypothetical protein
MKTWRLGALALLALSGCNQQTSVSGTYLARYTNGAAQMQLTESQSQQVMGSIIVITVKPDGQAVRQDVSVTGGTVDANGKSLVLTVKPNEIFAQAQNVSGQISDGAIDLQVPWGNSHFEPTKPGEFDAAVNALVATGKQQAQVQAEERAKQEQADAKAREIANQVRHIQDVTSSLAAYNNRIQSATWTPAVPREQEENLVARAKRGLDIQQELRTKHRDVDAAQAGVAIAQLTVAMNQIKIQVDQDIAQGRHHLTEFDQALSNSPCHANATLDGCIELGKEKMRYATTRRLVEGNLAQAESDIGRNQIQIEAISKQAGN